MARPFVWGECDCTSAACDVFRALHGVDPLAPWRGRYASVPQGWRLVVAMGGPDKAAEAMVQRAGMVPGQAVGGLGLAGKSLLICIQPGLFAGKTQNGFALVRNVERAWHLA